MSKELAVSIEKVHLNFNSHGNLVSKSTKKSSKNRESRESKDYVDKIDVSKGIVQCDNVISGSKIEDDDSGIDDGSERIVYVNNQRIQGGIYTGYVSSSSGKRENKGTFRDKNGDTYSGQWKNDQYSGKGRKVYKNGDCHEGIYLRGQRCGFGIFKWSNGDSYCGEFNEGHFHGSGKFIWADTGEIYSGDWHKGEMTGNGRKVQKDGFVEGCFLNGAAHGQATKSYNNGDSYNGHYHHNEKHGYGEYCWSDGSRYMGYWCRNNMHGSCSHFISKKYVNQCVQNYLRENRGISETKLDARIRWAHITYYRGEYIHGERNGFGIAVSPHVGEVLIGNFKNNLPNGFCTVYSILKGLRVLIYEGMMVDGERSGLGSLRQGTVDDFMHIVNELPREVIENMKHIGNYGAFLSEFKAVYESYKNANNFNSCLSTSFLGHSHMTGGYSTIVNYLGGEPIDKLKSQFRNELLSIINIDNHLEIITNLEQWLHILSQGNSVEASISLLQISPWSVLYRSDTNANIPKELSFYGNFQADRPHSKGTLTIEYSSEGPRKCSTQREFNCGTLIT